MSGEAEETPDNAPASGNPATDAERLRAYGEAGRTLNDWIAGAHALALLDAALSSGLLDAARTPGAAAHLAALAGLDAGRVADLCLALDAHGVLDREGDTYRLSPDFATLAAPDAPQSLPAIVDRARVVARLLARSLAPGETNANLWPEDVLALARGASGQPGSPLVQAMLAATSETFAEARSLQQAGGRHLELGCGVGGALLNLLAMHPALTAVGVEREPVLLAEARRQAEVLGVADRVEWRQTDARDLAEEAAYDTMSWSQFFFPTVSRAATLAVARRALKPGGYLTMPVLPDPPVTEAGLREAEGRAYARIRVLYGSWGVPVRTADEVRAEVEGAGFVFVRMAPGRAARFMLFRRPEA